MEASKLELIPVLYSLLAISLIYFVAKLCIARALIWERKKRGLVSFLPPSSENLGLLMAHSLQARCTWSFLHFRTSALFQIGLG